MYVFAKHFLGFMSYILINVRLSFSGKKKKNVEIIKKNVEIIKKNVEIIKKNVEIIKMKYS